MKKKLKLILNLFLFCNFFLFFTRGVYSQGTYQCVWQPPGQCELSGSNNCESGFIPGDCSGLDITECTIDPRECQLVDFSTNEYICTQQGSFCEYYDDKCDGSHFPGNCPNTCTASGYFIGTCEESATDECGPNDNCGGGVCTCPGSQVCTEIQAGVFRCQDPSNTNDNTKTFYEPNDCRIPVGSNPNDYFEGIETVLGCVPTQSTIFIRWFLNKAISIGGGIAFLIMIWGAFQVMTSSGDPEKLQEGKNILVSAGAGLLFIIFSVFILELIGYRILKIPGWGL